MAQAKHIGKVMVRGWSERRAGVRGEGTYVVTGGLGGLGLGVAEWLAGRGAKHLVLVGRSEGGEQARAVVEGMRGRGVDVEVVRADVSRLQELQRELGRVLECKPVVRGVVHAAGVVEDAGLGEEDWERMRRVMGAKVEGSWNLHELLGGEELDFFVMFSSVASVVGTYGQVGYAAANAFMDGLAERRRSEGRAGLSIAWGPWGGVGMAARMGEEWTRRARERGIGTLEIEEGLEALGGLLGGERGQAVVARVDWEKLLGGYAGGDEPPLFRRLAESQRGRARAAERRGELEAELARTPAAGRWNVLLAHVRHEAAKVLGLDASDPIDIRRPLHELGLDSLMALDLRNALSATTRSGELSPTLLFDYPTIEALTRYLATRMLDTVAAGAEKAVERPGAGELAALEKVEQLSDQEVESLLREKLQSSA
jgi:NAD(P)-dependent dehydrogenase (short-subunit alcohol dehydrogenase family)/acyl carrier protein